MSADEPTRGTPEHVRAQVAAEVAAVAASDAIEEAVMVLVRGACAADRSRYRDFLETVALRLGGV